MINISYSESQLKLLINKFENNPYIKNEYESRIRFLLMEFWNRFCAVDSENYKINILIEFEKIVIKHKNSSLKKRNKFNVNRHFLKIFEENCQVCGDNRVIRHHIISLIHGGNNSKSNLIPICRKCHSMIHPHLQTDLPCNVADGQQGIEGSTTY